MKKHRIFLVLGGKATSGDSNNIWVRNLYDPLVNIGHDVFLLNIDEDLEGPEHQVFEDRKQRLSNALPTIFNREHAKKPFDIFFSYLHTRQVDPEVLAQIRKQVYTINYSTNYHQFEIYKDKG